MAKNAIQRTAVKRGDRKGRASALKTAQLNIRITPETMDKLRKLAKISGKSQAWIVEHAILQSVEFGS